jgi:hypothetical protein
VSDGNDELAVVALADTCARQSLPLCVACTRQRYVCAYTHAQSHATQMRAALVSALSAVELTTVELDVDWLARSMCRDYRVRDECGVRFDSDEMLS